MLSACFAFKRQEECRKRYGGYPRTGYSTLSCALSMTGRESPWYRCLNNFSHGPNDTRLYSHVHAFTRSHVRTFTRSRVDAFTRSHVHSFTQNISHIHAFASTLFHTPACQHLNISRVDRFDLFSESHQIELRASVIDVLVVLGHVSWDSGLGVRGNFREKYK